MKMAVKTQVFLELSGPEAEELAQWMHANNACGDNAVSQSTSFSSAIAGQLLRRLRELPEVDDS
jgi:hypothetical protein